MFLEDNNLCLKYNLYIPIKTKKQLVSNIYLDRIYDKNIFDDVDYVKKYAYIINIENRNQLAKFKHGFIETCLTLLNTKTDFIYMGEKQKQKKALSHTVKQI